MTHADATAFAEDSTLSINLAASLTDTDGSESVSSYTLTGFTAGTTFSAGSANADGSWTVSAADAAGLTMTLAPHDDTDFTLTVMATSQEVDPDTGATSSTTSSASVAIAVSAVADAVSVEAADTSGAPSERLRWRSARN